MIHEPEWSSNFLQQIFEPSLCFILCTWIESGKGKLCGHFLFSGLLHNLWIYTSHLEFILTGTESFLTQPHPLSYTHTQFSLQTLLMSKKWQPLSVSSLTSQILSVLCLLPSAPQRPGRELDLVRRERWLSSHCSLCGQVHSWLLHLEEKTTASPSLTSSDSVIAISHDQSSSHLTGKKSTEQGSLLTFLYMRHVCLIFNVSPPSHL